MQSSIYKVQPKDQIIRLELELTNICNLKCPLCVRETHGIKGKDWRPLEEVKEQLDQFPNLEFVTLAGSSAEPTTYPHLFEVIKYLRDRDINIELYINGDTKTDAYYMSLGVIFRSCKGNVYFTICGSTQELHEKYRVNSNLERVMRRIDIFDKFSDNKGILTWIVFSYNQDDFEANYQRYKKKYNTEFFYTLPFDEHYELNSEFRLPDKEHKFYMENIDRNSFPTDCVANKNNFLTVGWDGEEAPCSLYRIHGESHCFECSAKNFETIRRNKIHNVAEPESGDSNVSLRLYYDKK